MKLEGPISEYSDSKEVDYRDLNLGDVWARQKPPKPAKVAPEVYRFGARDLIPIREGTSVSFVDSLAGIVNQAQQIVCLSSYMIQQSALTQAILSAASKGVRVYVLTAGEEELARLDSDVDDVDKAKVEDYRQLLNSMAGQVLIRTAPHFHAKFLLVDPLTARAQGIMMTCNMTQDAMAGKNIEAAVRLTKAEVGSFFSQFVRGFWKEAKHELLRPGELGGARSGPESIRFGEFNHPATLSGSTSLKEKVLSLIDAAGSTVVVTGWSFGIGHPVIASLTKAIERGVAVKVFTRPTSGNTDSLVALGSKGAEIRGHERYHAKMVIADSKRSLVMTSNFTERGLDSGFEVGIELDADETKGLVNLEEYWESLCEWKLQPSLRLGDAPQRVLRKIPASRKLELTEVEEETNKDFGSHILTSLDGAEFVPPIEPANPNTQSGNKLYRKVRYSWKVIPPTVPTQASLVRDAGTAFPLYKRPNGELFIVVSRWEEVEAAKPIALSRKAKLVAQRQKQ